MDALAQRLVRTFMELVRVDSPTFEEGAFADDVEARLQQLGLSTWRDDTVAATGCDTGNLFGRLDGLEGMPTLAFMAHMDTVEPGRGIEPVVDGDVVKSSGSTVLGADDKAAAAVIVEALTTLQEAGHPHGDVIVVFTVAEEKGLLGVKAMAADAFEADHSFVLDAGGQVGRVVSSAPTQNTIRAVIHGKAAHAGVEPEKGVDALAAAARAIASMRLGRIDEETTANIGRIEGGRATNIIADRIELAGEARSHDPAKLEAQTQTMIAALRATEESGCWADIEVVEEYRGFSFEGDEPIMRLFERACARIGIEPVMKPTGGGSDANLLNSRGHTALALGLGMEQAHSVDEHLRVADLVAGHDLVLALIAEAMAD